MLIKRCLKHNKESKVIVEALGEHNFSLYFFLHKIKLVKVKNKNKFYLHDEKKNCLGEKRD